MNFSKICCEEGRGMQDCLSKLTPPLSRCWSSFPLADTTSILTSTPLFSGCWSRLHLADILTQLQHLFLVGVEVAFPLVDRTSTAPTSTLLFSRCEVVSPLLTQLQHLLQHFFFARSALYVRGTVKIGCSVCSSVRSFVRPFVHVKS